MPTDQFDALTGHAARHDALDAAVAAPTFVSATAPTSPAEGATWLDTSGSEPVLKVWVDGSPGEWAEVGDGGPVDAEDVGYDNTASGLAATDVQAAIDELAAAPGGGGAYDHAETLFYKSDRARVQISNAGKTISPHVGENSTCAMIGVFKSTGKWYFEVLVSAMGASGTVNAIGIAGRSRAINGSLGTQSGSPAGENDAWVWNGLLDIYIESSSAVSAGVGFAANDVVMVAVDCANNSIWFGKNGNWNGGSNPATNTGAHFTNLGGLIAPALQPGGGSLPTGIMTIRVLSSEFSYTPPSGFSPWVT
jgi:hypothetical protein